ncbi:hypothetical protein BD309DRAFT_995528 [Dichomitus squalens]|nr:hypothetical protein BD309DRAFT_995528 [Dichomitus squalens]
MDGYGSTIANASDNKWGKIYSLMKTNHIGILLLQETHLTVDRVNALHKQFAKRIKIYFSAHPDLPTRRDGVAIVVNKSIVRTQDAASEEIVLGKALQLTVSCLGGEKLTGVSVRSEFYESVRERYATHPRLPKPQLMAGDFNNIEDTLDRLPMSEAPDNSVVALDQLKLALETNPNRRERASLSRLDRIYMMGSMFETAYEWEIQHPAIRTDHRLVSVKLTSETAPDTGKGRPVFLLHLLRDRKLARSMHETGHRAMEKLKAFQNGAERTREENPQTVFAALKKD